MKTVKEGCLNKKRKRKKIYKIEKAIRLIK